jgi:hypothetical protein
MKDATGIAWQGGGQRLPTAREPNLQTRFLEVTSGHRGGDRRSRDRSGGGSCSRHGSSSCTIAQRLFLRRLLRALPLVSFDLRLDRGEGLLVVLLFCKY